MPRAKSPPVSESPSEPVAPYTGTMLDAMDLAGLTGPSFDAWRTVWRSVFALPMDETDRARFQKHTGRTEPPTQPVSELWLPVGGRGGKSRNVACAGVYLAVRRDYRPLLAPGERARIPIIASDREQAGQVLRFVKGITAEAFAPWVVGRALANSVEFSTGVTVDIATASYRTIRGYTIVALIGDEIAFWSDEDSAEPDAEILNAARPRMAMIPGSMLFALSTPYARKGELYKMVSNYYGKDDPRILVWNSDTRSMNPSYPQSEVDRQFENDPIVAASEVGTDGKVLFRSDVEAYLSAEAVAAVTVSGRRELLPIRDTHGTVQQKYVAFTDPSGGSQDSWSLAIAHREPRQRLVDAAQDAGLRSTPEMAVLDCVREWPPPFSPDSVVREQAVLLRTYGISEVEGDRYAGEFPRELFRRHGITYRVIDATKSDIYRDFLPTVNAGRCELLEHRRMQAQLCGLERHVARGGLDNIDHAPGGHDDIANVVAGALVRAARQRPAVSVRFAL